MRILCASNENGADKTALLAGLAGAFAATGRSVLMLDLAPPASLARWFGMANPNSLGSFALYAQSEKAPSLRVAQVAHPSKQSRIALAPVADGLAMLERDDASHPGIGRMLIRAFTDMTIPYDYVVLDCPAAFGELMLSALASADVVLAPTPAEPRALQALDNLLRTAAIVEHSRQRALPVLVVPSTDDQNIRVAQESLAALRARDDCTVWHEQIPLANVSRDASLYAFTPEEFDTSSHTATVFARLATWVSQEVPLQAPTEPACCA